MTRLRNTAAFPERFRATVCRRSLLGAVLLVASIWSSPALAWSEAGHIAIADAAFQRLPAQHQDDLNKLATRLIEQQPQLRDLAKRYSKASPTALTGAWLDSVRGIPVKEIFARVDAAVPAGLEHLAEAETDDWHYSNIYYGADAVDLEQCPPPGGRLIEVLQALRESFPSASPESQAVILAMLIHLVADAHQPLHTLSRISTGCRHDRGGNSVCVSDEVDSRSSGRCEMNLHRLWDRGFGVFRGPWDQQLNRLQAAQETGKREDIFALHHWQRENLVQAKAVYGFSEGEELSREYLRQGKDVAQARAAMAAVRLGRIMAALAKEVQ